MAWYLAREYGDSVEVAYNDLSQPDVRQRFPSIIEQLRKGDLALPAVFVDDRMVALGYVDYFTITRAIEEIRVNGQT